jgi:hypothetical protein
MARAGFAGDPGLIIACPDPVRAHRTIVSSELTARGFRDNDPGDVSDRKGVVWIPRFDTMIS